MSLKIVRVLLAVALVVSFLGHPTLWAKGKEQVAEERVTSPIAYSIEEYERMHDPSLAPSSIFEPYEVTGTVVGTSILDYATAYYPRSIAVGSDGVVHIVWCTEGDPNNEVLYVHSTDQGQTFSTPVEVHDGYYGYKPSVAVDPTNPLNVFVAYVGYQNMGEVRSVRISKSTDGGLNWGASVPIFGSILDTNNPDIVVDNQGNPHVAFDCYSDIYLRYNYSADGGETWFTEPEVVSIGHSTDVFSACISLDNDGNAHVLFGGGGSTGSWGDKGVYWNWRDMTIGMWREVPPMEISAPGTGTPYPTMVWDSQGVAHVWYDAAGSASQRGVYYLEYEDGEWSEPVEIMSSVDGGSTYMPSAAVDQYDNLYLCYLDALENATDLTDNNGDIFTGTNITGEWQYVNFTSTGLAQAQRHPGCAYHVVDSLLHLVYTGGPSGGPYSIIHEVGFPWPPEPSCGINQLSDTYSTTGPFTIDAITGDVEGYVVSCSLYVWVNGELEHSIEMTETATNAYQAEFSLDGFPNDSVAYQGVATDDEGLKGPSMMLNFKILEPVNQMCDILLIDNDGQIDSLIYHGMYEECSFYSYILDSLGYYYELWDIDEHKGIDASVTGFGWKTIIVYGWVAGSVPTRDYTDDPYAAFLQEGTSGEPANLVVLSQDYFYANAEPEGDLVFEPGDFAYDFFQIGEGTSDPEQTENDSLLIGIEGDPISGSFAETPIELDKNLFADMTGSSGDPNWIDWTVAVGGGLDIFYAANQGFGSGVRYDAGTFKTVHLPWMVSMLLDTVIVDTDTTGVPNSAAYTLMQNILTWFVTDTGQVVGVKSEPGAKLPGVFALHHNYPNPFNPVTHIAYDLPGDSRVELSIYNLLGQKVRTLVNRDMSSGHHVAVWDGKNEFGSPVSTGIYFYRIRAADFKENRKMILLK